MFFVTVNQKNKEKQEEEEGGGDGNGESGYVRVLVSAITNVAVDRILKVSYKIWNYSISLTLLCSTKTHQPSSFFSSTSYSYSTALPYKQK